MNKHFNLGIEFRDPTSILADPANAKIHTQKQIAQICRSIVAFGFVDPILIDESDVIIAGHGRLLAALKLGLGKIPTIRVAHLSHEQKLALGVAHNQLTLNTGFDTAKLREILIVITSPAIDLGDAIGLETPEQDIIIDGSADTQKPDPIDQIEEPGRSVPATTRIGDLVRLGSHFVYCGDALDPASYGPLMGDEMADLIVTDAPYNRKVSAIGNSGRVQHPEFAQASGELANDQFQSFLDRSLRNMQARVRNGAIINAFMDWRGLDKLLQTGKALDLELKNILVWDKVNGGMGSLYRSQHELIAVFKHGQAPHTNNIELGRHGRYRTNVMRYAGATMFSRSRKRDLETHPTVKPIALIVDLIKDCSHRNDIILDGFGGSGTTLLAAERTGRRARLIEIDPYYVDATIARWVEMTNGKPEVVSQPEAA